QRQEALPLCPPPKLELNPFHRRPALSLPSGGASPSRIDWGIEAALRLDRFGGIEAKVLAVARADNLNTQREAIRLAGRHRGRRQAQQIYGDQQALDTAQSRPIRRSVRVESDRKRRLRRDRTDD